MDKALVSHAGRPLLAHAVDALAGVADEVVVNCRADQVESFAAALPSTSIRFAVDDVPDAGPVAGLERGLAAAGGSHALVLPCDRPRVPPALLARLLDAARDCSGAVARFDGRRRHFPLAVAVGAGFTAARSLSSDGASIAGFLDALGPAALAELPEHETSALAGECAFHDIDTPADLRRIEAAHSSGDGASLTVQVDREE